MAGGEESFATGSPTSQTINRDSESESSVDQGTGALLAGAGNHPETPAAAAAVPGTVAFDFGETGATTETTMSGNTGNNNPGSNTPTTTTITPKFGGTYPGSNTAVWIGGAPNEAFTGTVNGMPKTPLCIRGLEPSYEMKGYTTRVMSGCATKFKRDDPEFPLMAFAAECLNHMESHGLDTVFYMKGVKSDGTGGEELFTYHTKYTKSQVDRFIQEAQVADAHGVKKFDSFCVQALQESQQWLMNSLDESLKSALRPCLAKKPTGPQLWMAIVAEVQSDSLRRCQQLVKKFEALSLSQFKGENVREYAKAAEELLLQLERDEQLPPTHLLSIVDDMTSCSVMDFKVMWMNKRSKVEAFLKESMGKDRSAVAAMPDRIHFSDLLEEAKEMFTNLQEKWGATPAKPKEDAMMAQLKAMTAKVDKITNQLKGKPTPAETTQGGGGSGRARRCFKCGSLDHIKKDCPKESNPDGKNEGGGGNNCKNKWPPPKDGEPHQKTVNGKTWKWCQKCANGQGRWNLTHKTAAHKDGFRREQNQKKKDEAAAGNEAAGDGHLHCLPCGVLDQTMWVDRF